MKYLKTWMGVTSWNGLGGMGDSGGYPEMKFQIIESLDDLIKTYNEQAEYYKLVPVDINPVVIAAKDLTTHVPPTHT